MDVAIDILPSDSEFSFEPGESVTIESLDDVQHPAVGTQRSRLLGGQYGWALRYIRLKGTDGAGLPHDLTAHGVKARAALFNVVVALEWTPSAAFLDELRHAFTAASHLLYDVTDGFMAIGQVVVGGPVLMPVADIQMFASNRLLPRSSVFGLLNPAEYRPIRLGRGLWDKNEHRAIP